MKVILILALIGAAVTIILADGKYTSKFDNIDLDEILNSERLLKNYMNCLLDKGSCTPDGTELKKNIPDGLANECSKCTEKQKKGTDKVFSHLINKKIDWWKQLVAKYDPKGQHHEKLEKRYKN